MTDWQRLNLNLALALTTYNYNQHLPMPLILIFWSLQPNKLKKCNSSTTYDATPKSYDNSRHFTTKALWDAIVRRSGQEKKDQHSSCAHRRWTGQQEKEHEQRHSRWAELSKTSVLRGFILSTDVNGCLTTPHSHQELKIVFVKSPTPVCDFLMCKPICSSCLQFQGRNCKI